MSNAMTTIEITGAYGIKMHTLKLRDGFAECFRVLKPTGVLVFKWSDVQVHLSEILPLALPHRPLIGNKKAKTSGTHWVLFLKEAR
jgi:ubiquinone/menaquinone biosynthesis C-methylase UbiE